MRIILGVLQLLLILTLVVGIGCALMGAAFSPVVGEVLWTPLVGGLAVAALSGGLIWLIQWGWDRLDELHRVKDDLNHVQKNLDWSERRRIAAESELAARKRQEKRRARKALWPGHAARGGKRRRP